MQMEAEGARGEPSRAVGATDGVVVEVAADGMGTVEAAPHDEAPAAAEAATVEVATPERAAATATEATTIEIVTAAAVRAEGVRAEVAPHKGAAIVAAARAARAEAASVEAVRVEVPTPEGAVAGAAETAAARAARAEAVIAEEAAHLEAAAIVETATAQAAMAEVTLHEGAAVIAEAETVEAVRSEVASHEGAAAAAAGVAPHGVETPEVAPHGGVTAEMSVNRVATVVVASHDGARAAAEIAPFEAVTAQEATAAISELAAMQESEGMPAARAETACDEQHLDASQTADRGDSCGTLSHLPHRQPASLGTSRERVAFLRSNSGPDLGEALLDFFEYYGAVEAPLRGVMDPLAPQVDAPSTRTAIYAHNALLHKRNSFDRHRHTPRCTMASGMPTELCPPFPIRLTWGSRRTSSRRRAGTSREQQRISGIRGACRRLSSVRAPEQARQGGSGRV